MRSALRGAPVTFIRKIAIFVAIQQIRTNPDSYGICSHPSRFWSRPQQGSGECAARQHTVVEPNQLPRRGLSTMLQLHRPHLIGSYRFTPFNHRIHKKSHRPAPHIPQSRERSFGVCMARIRGNGWTGCRRFQIGHHQRSRRISLLSNLLRGENARNRHGYRKRCR